mmetsp:Transcript_17264/g.37068  ORF Transcript_17264/g.37068 Transcript_17264/m.37068 type:complete len:980 (+) Transcript_17264:94-3033(+)
MEGAKKATPNYEAGTRTGSNDADDMGNLTVITSLNEYSGETPAQQLESVLKRHPVFAFSKTYCPFCIEVKRTLSHLGVPLAVIEIDSNADGAKLSAVSKANTKHKTYPSVYIKGQHIGGCDSLMSLQRSGELDRLVRDLVVRPAGMGGQTLETLERNAVPRGTARHPLLWFPNTTNNHVVRVNAAIVVALSVVAIIFRDRSWAKWFVLGMCIDYTVLMCVGSTLSLSGTVSNLLTSPLPPDVRAGPGKQFANLCGVCFTAMGTGCYFGDQPEAGAVILACLVGAAGLQAFADFCVACLFFDIGLRLKIVPNDVFRIFANMQQETKDAWQYAHVSSGPAKPVHVDTNPQSRTALKYKIKSEEWTMEDFHLVRNVQITYFAVPMGLAGLAVAWKLATSWTDTWALSLGLPGVSDTLDIPTIVYKVVGLIAAFVYVVLAALYLIRFLRFRRKVLKEWQCPLRGASFGMATICLMLFAFLVYDVDGDVDNKAVPNFGRALWWIGAVGHMAMTVVKFGEWVGKRLELEHVHVSWMILPVGNLVAAMVAPLVDALASRHGAATAAVYGESLSVELGSFYFSFGYFMWLALFSITLLKVLTTHNSDESIRTLTFVWVAAPAVAGLADLVLCAEREKSDVVAPALSVAQCLPTFNQYLYLAIVMLLGLSWSAMPYIAFLGRAPFNMSYWNFVFPLAAIAAACVVYFATTGFLVGRVFAIVGLVAASAGAFVASMHTLILLVHRRGIFTPMPKFGPLAHFNLLHEAIRGAIPKLTDTLTSMDAANADSVVRFALEFRDLQVVHEEHSNHEDAYIFKLFAEFFDGHTRKYNDDHSRDHVLLHKMADQVNLLLSPSSSSEAKAAAVADLQRDVPPFIEHLLEHLQGEEDNLKPIGKRYLPIAAQVEMTRSIFFATPAKRWELIMPYVLTHLPRHGQRVNYLKAFFWALPERAQQIGAILHRNLDAVMWERLRIELPEMVPRAAFNHWRYY